MANSLNLRIVQKLDPAAEELLFVGKHAVLYNFENDVWVLDLLA